MKRLSLEKAGLGAPSPYESRVGMDSSVENLRSEMLLWGDEGLTLAWVIQWVNCFDGHAGRSLKHWLGMANIFSFLGQWINECLLRAKCGPHSTRSWKKVIFGLSDWTARRGRGSAASGSWGKCWGLKKSQVIYRRKLYLLRLRELGRGASRDMQKAYKPPHKEQVICSIVRSRQQRTRVYGPSSSKTFPFPFLFQSFLPPNPPN